MNSKMISQNRVKIVLELLEKKVQIRKISKDQKMSTRDVIKIKKEKQKIEEECKNQDRICKILDYYENGKNPVDVARDFKIDLESAKSLYLEFLETNKLYSLAETLRKLDKDWLQSFINLFESMNSKRITNDKLNEIIEIVDDIPDISRDYFIKVNELKRIKNEIKISYNARNILFTKNSELRKEKLSIETEIIEKKKDLNELKAQKKLKEESLKVIIEKIRVKHITFNQIAMAFENDDIENQVKSITLRSLSNLSGIIVDKIVLGVGNDENKSLIKMITEMENHWKDNYNLENYLRNVDKLKQYFQRILDTIPEIVWSKLKNEPLYG